MATPSDVLKMLSDEERRHRRHPLLRPSRAHAALLDPRARAHRGRLRGRARLRRLVDPRVPGDPGVGHAPDPGPRHRGDRPVHEAQDAQHQLLRRRTRSPASPTAATRATSRRRPRTTCAAPASPTPRTSVPRPSSTSSTPRASTRTSTRATTSSTRSRACGTPGAPTELDGIPEPRVQGPVQGGVLPRPADGPVPGPPLGDAA